jgi:hypothetical protein
MHRSFRIPTGVLASALALGCGDQLATTEPVGAGVNLAVIQNERVPFTTEYADPCNGEIIAFEGFLHNLIHETADGSGGFHAAVGYNLTVRGVGQTTGATYTGTEASSDAFNIKPPYPVNETFTIHTNVIGQGQAPDFRAHLTFHVTVNANGNLTVIFEKFRAVCRGA